MQTDKQLAHTPGLLHSQCWREKVSHSAAVRKTTSSKMQLCL